MANSVISRPESSSHMANSVINRAFERTNGISRAFERTIGVSNRAFSDRACKLVGQGALE
jgi:hypothetical protein